VKVNINGFLIMIESAVFTFVELSALCTGDEGAMICVIMSTAIGTLDKADISSLDFVFRSVGIITEIIMTGDKRR